LVERWFANGNGFAFFIPSLFDEFFLLHEFALFINTLLLLLFRCLPVSAPFVHRCIAFFSFRFVVIFRYDRRGGFLFISYNEYQKRHIYIHKNNHIK